MAKLEGMVKGKKVPVNFEPGNSALIVIDMQNEFCSVGGEGTIYGVDVEKTTRKPIPVIQRILPVARRAGIKVFYTRSGHREDLLDLPEPVYENHLLGGLRIGQDGPHGGRSHIRYTWNTEIVDELKPAKGDIVIEWCSGFNKFYSTDFDAILRKLGIRVLFFTGVNTNVCVSSTIRDATDRGYRSVIIHDACASYSEAGHESELKTLSAVFCPTTDSKAFVEAVNAAGKVVLSSTKAVA